MGPGRTIPERCPSQQKANIYVRSLDRVGNESSTVQGTARIDKTSPSDPSIKLSDATCTPNPVTFNIGIARTSTRMMGIQLEVYEGTFKDVHAEEWYAPYVGTSLSHNVITGISRCIFAPIREQASVILTNVTKSIKGNVQRKVRSLRIKNGFRTGQQSGWSTCLAWR
ncbi:hypothetical protein KQI74_22675 [Paenibacillus barcinonensis]|uniref:hypothetical protein n=1 Tax=Paenibacillus barcinonensis TaxID=198119 RepID=UPI001C119EA0|nr:hypothetical protein [Paenibacillus barcinonensis]MBU5355093.1 hypothetical protein [Paenibacillus barcinonensis]